MGRLARTPQERLVAPLARGERHAQVDAARGESVEMGKGEAGVKVGVRLDGPRVDGAAAQVLGAQTKTRSSSCDGGVRLGALLKATRLVSSA